MFKSIYYAGNDEDDRQRVSHENSDSAYYVEFHDLDKYIRVGVQDTDDGGKPLSETWVCLEMGKSHSTENPYWWGGTLTQFAELMRQIDNTEETHAHKD